jgi:hypothetical protein
MALAADLIVDRVVLEVELPTESKREFFYHYIIIRCVVHYKIAQVPYDVVFLYNLKHVSRHILSRVLSNYLPYPKN